jgi:predicted PurR-regulated permease PerM
MATQGKKFFYIILGLSIIGLIFFLKSYAAVIIFSVLVAMLFHPLYNKIFLKLKGRQTISLIITFIVMILCFLLPLTLVAFVVTFSIRDVSAQTGLANFAHSISLTQIIDKMNLVLHDTFKLNLIITSDVIMERVKDFSVWSANLLFGNIKGIASSIFGFIPLAFILCYVTGAVLVHYHKISTYLHDLSPLNDEIDRLYVNRLKAMAMSMVKGTFLVAITQGLITGLFLWIAGVPYAFFLTLLAIVFSVIPLGAGVINVPVSIILILTGNIWQGVLILLVQFLVISNVDNILRPRLVDKKATLHPALVLIGLFAGIANFGFMGLVYGPVLMIFFVTTIQVYKQYFPIK